MKTQRNAKATANDETEWLLELSSNQRTGAFEVQDFIGNLRSMKEKMEAENRELQREWETMKNHRARRGGGKQQQQEKEQEQEQEQQFDEQQLPPSASQIPSDEMDGRQERETSRERSESPSAMTGGTRDGISVDRDDSLRYSADEASINMLEAQNEKLRQEFQSMKAQFASVENPTNQQDWVSESSSGEDEESSSVRSTNKYKTMLIQAVQSNTVEHVPPVSSSEKIDSDEIERQSRRDGDSESSSVDSSSSSSCSDSATFRSLRSIKYSQTKKSSTTASRKGSDEFHVDLDSLAETSDYQSSCQSRSEKESVDIDGETIEVVFSSKQIEEQRRRRYRDRHSVFDKEDESRSERNSILSGVTSVASSLARPKRSEIRALGREVIALRGLTKKQKEEIEKERQNQGNIIVSLKEQMEKVVARECQLRKELAEARDQAHMTESQLYGKKHSRNHHRGDHRSEDKDYWLQQELKASQCQVKRQNQAIAALKRQLNGSPDGSTEEKAMRLETALERVQVVEEENDELRGINQDLLQTKDLLVQVREAMESQLDEHKATQDRLEGQLEEGQTRVARLREEVFELRRESDNLRRDLEEARKAYEDLGAARRKIEELERDRDVLKAKGEQDRARLLKQSLDNHKAKNVANRQLEEVLARERKREAEFSKNHKELQSTKTTLDERTLRLEEVQLSLSEHQRELSGALERTEGLLKENRELRVVTGQMEQVMRIQADEDREALSDLKRQLEEAKTGETLLRQELDEAKTSAEAYRVELEESKVESADKVQSLNRQLKSINASSKDLEAERTRLYRELRLVNEEAQEHRMKAEKFEKAFIISQQQKSLLETNLSDAVAQLHVAKQVHREDVRQADDRIWHLEDVLDSQQTTIKRWKETARRRGVDGDKACGVPFMKFT